MCRVLAYLGHPVLLDDLLYKPDSSLVRQSYDPKMMLMLNLAGFGMTAWDPESHDPQTPYTYKTPLLPVFDQNLKQLAQKIRAAALIAHIRGVPYSERSVVGAQNLHPFRFEGFRLALAHNGGLWRFGDMKFELLKYIRPEIATRIQGTTDSEWIYALLMSQIRDPASVLDVSEITDAVERTLNLIGQVREEQGIRIASPVNLFLCDGNQLVATRYTFDYGCYPDDPLTINLIYPSLWYTLGREYGYRDGEWKMIGRIGNYDSVIIASEPLTRDVSTWLELPEYSMLCVSMDRGGRAITTKALDI
jgi:glutamine amidotransferase